MTLASGSSNFNGSGVALSAPGAMSTRTDLATQGAMQMPDAAYGEQADFQQIQGGAPMAAAPLPPAGLFAPTERPDEPITAGALLGPGPGPEALMRQQPTQQQATLTATLRKMAQADPTGDSQFLAALAERLGW